MDDVGGSDVLNALIGSMKQNDRSTSQEPDLDSVFQNNELLSGELGNLTKNIMQDIDVKSMMTDMDPMSLMTGLMNPDSIKEDDDNPLFGLINNISGKIQSHLDKGND